MPDFSSAQESKGNNQRVSMGSRSPLALRMLGLAVPSPPLSNLQTIASPPHINLTEGQQHRRPHAATVIPWERLRRENRVGAQPSVTLSEWVIGQH